jgi:putative ABC transport system ATP-binding protein
MAIIAANNLSKTFGKRQAEFQALKKVNLSIKEGETVAVVGKSGSGKSTLMHLLALLDEPSSGTVMVGDQDSTKLSGRELDLLRNKTYGFVFQQFFINGNDTVLSNVMLPLKIAGVGRRERKRRGMEVLKAVELEEKAKNLANDLSGGQKQRVCIARALINNPSIIFADEPTGNLDSATGDKIIDLLFSLNKEQSITLIIVTHDSELAARCKRRIYLKDGVITKGGN